MKYIYIGLLICLLTIINLKAQTGIHKSNLIYKGENVSIEINYDSQSKEFYVVIKNLSDGVMYLNSRYPYSVPGDYFYIKINDDYNNIYLLGTYIINDGFAGLRPNHGELMSFNRLASNATDTLHFKPLSHNNEVNEPTNFYIESEFEYFILPKTISGNYLYLENGLSNINVLEWLNDNGYKVNKIFLGGQVCCEL